MIRSGRALLAAAFLFAPEGCKRKTGGPHEVPPPAPDPAPHLGPVAVEDRTPPEGAIAPTARIDADVIAQAVRERLRTSGLFAAGNGDGGGGPVARVRIELGLEEVRGDDKAAARAGVRFRVDTRPSGVAQPHWTEDVRAGAETTFPLAPEPDRKAIFAKLATRTVNDLLTAYLGRQRLWRAEPADLRNALAVETGDLKVEAIRVIAERRLVAEAPALLKLLSDQDESVRDSALGALVELRERRAVGEIARQRSMRDKREMRKIIDAIATLGGEEAREYLGFVAEGHDDPEIKQMAARALERLNRRADGGG